MPCLEVSDSCRYLRHFFACRDSLLLLALSDYFHFSFAARLLASNSMVVAFFWKTASMFLADQRTQRSRVHEVERGEFMCRSCVLPLDASSQSVSCSLRPLSAAQNMAISPIVLCCWRPGHSHETDAVPFAEGDSDPSKSFHRRLRLLGRRVSLFHLSSILPPPSFSLVAKPRPFRWGRSRVALVRCHATVEERQPGIGACDQTRWGAETVTDLGNLFVCCNTGRWDVPVQVRDYSLRLLTRTKAD